MITDIIKPITLLRGHHADTGQTGSGCAMDVIAYLNGDAEITDNSSCVCGTVRPFLRTLNDLLSDSDRHLLIPYIERAMGSATDNAEIIKQRLARVVAFAEYAAVRAAASAGQSAMFAKHAGQYAEYAQEAAESAIWAASVAHYIQSMVDLLDDILPHPTHGDDVVARAQQLVKIAEAHKEKQNARATV